LIFRNLHTLLKRLLRKFVLWSVSKETGGPCFKIILEMKALAIVSDSWFGIAMAFFLLGGGSRFHTKIYTFDTNVILLKLERQNLEKKFL
jgi:hypothetical protein